MSKKGTRNQGKWTIYEKKPNVWIYQTYSFYNSMDGKKKKQQKYLGEKSKRVLENMVKQWNKYYDEVDSNYDRKTPFEKPPQGVLHIIKLYLKDRKKALELEEISKSSLRFASENMPIFEEWYNKEYGDKLVEKVRTTDLQNYRTFIKTKGWANQTISIRLRAVRTFFKWCLDNKYIDETPFTSEISIPKYKQKKDDEVPMGDDWQRIYDNMKKPAFIFDGRNILEKKKLEIIGFVYQGIGKV